MTLHLLTAQPWLVTDDALQTMLAIAAREQADEPAALARLEQRRAFVEPRGDAPAGAHYTTTQDGIATIEVIGPIFRYANLFTAFSGGTTTAYLSADLQRATDDPTIRAVVLAFDSPGGEATGIHELAAAIRAATAQKPVIAYVGGMAASAAYWLASACSEVICDATAELGSIGAVLALPNKDARSSREIEIVSSQSPKKRPDPATESGRAQYQARVDALAAEFVASVARYRGVSEATVLADFGQGGVMAGRAAVASGMADRLGSYQDVLADLRQRSYGTGLRRGAAHERTAMNWKDMFSGMFAAAKDAEAAEAADAAEAEAVTDGTLEPLVDASEAQATIAALEARLAQIDQTNAAAADAQIAAAARGFAEDLIASERFLPAQAAELEAVYRACDAAGVVPALQTLTAQQPVVSRTAEVIAVQDGAQVVQLGAAADPYAADKERARAYAESKRR